MSLAIFFYELCSAMRGIRLVGKPIQLLNEQIKTHKMEFPDKINLCVYFARMCVPMAECVTHVFHLGIIIIILLFPQ